VPVSTTWSVSEAATAAIASSQYSLQASAAVAPAASPLDPSCDALSLLATPFDMWRTWLQVCCMVLSVHCERPRLEILQCDLQYLV